MMYEFLAISPIKILAANQIEEAENSPYQIYTSGYWRCTSDLIAKAEAMLGFKMPDQLRAWYTEVGVGQITTPDRPTFVSDNNILIPTDIPKIINGTCAWMLPYTNIQPDTLPFFERDVDLFLCLHHNGENPNAVHWMWGEKICDSLVEFFSRSINDPDWFNQKQ